jgi:uncharacterized protein (DUF58 family)
VTERSERKFLDSAVLSRLSRLTLEARAPMMGSISGMHKSATRGSSVEFAEYRKYVQGDDIRHIDWRVYGRTDRFYMKEFEADTNLRCYLVIDTSSSMTFASKGISKFEYAQKLAATLAWLLVHQGDAVGMVCYEDKLVQEIAPRRSPVHLRDIFNALDATEPKGTTDTAGVLHSLAEKAKQRALVIVFSDFLADVDELMDSFQHMRFKKHDLAVFHMLDRQEVDFSFDRPIRFVDLESPNSMVTDPSVVREGYMREVQKHLNAMKKGSREFGVDYRQAYTDADYEPLLASFLLERMNKKTGNGR